MAKKQYNVWLEDELLTKIKHEIVDRKMTGSDLMKELVEQYFQKKEGGASK